MSRRRGTRHKDLVSGSSYVTVPSGVSIGPNGIQAANASWVTPALLSQLTSLAGPAIGATSQTGIQMAADTVNWAGASIAIDTGLTTITSFTGVYRIQDGITDYGTSPPILVYLPSATAGIVTAALYVTDADAAPTELGSGGSIAWMAFGT